MKLGFMVMGRSLSQAVKNARLIEQGGFDTVWVGEAAVDGFVYATAIAAATTTVTIGTAVALLTRPPAQAALAAAGIDELSNGRFTLGLGVGPADRNRDWFGLDPDRPIARMREYVSAFRAAWRSAPGRPANHEGERFPVRGFARRFASPTADLPVYVGVVGPQSTRAAAGYADGLIFNVLLPPAYLDAALSGPVADGLEASGRTRADLQIGGVIAVSVADDPVVSLDRARRQLLTYALVHYFEPVFADLGFADEMETVRARLRAGQVGDAAASVPEALIRQVAVVGTAAEAREQIWRWTNLLDFAVIAPPAAFLSAEDADESFQLALAALSPLAGD